MCPSRHLPYRALGALVALGLALTFVVRGPVQQDSQDQDSRVESSAGWLGSLGGSALLGESLEASPLTPLKDTDGDLLPDMLEEVVQSNALKSDSDGDGRNDFIEQLEYSPPMVADKGNGQNDGFRVLMHTTSLPANGELLWVHVMFRMRSGMMTDLKMMTLFLDAGGQRMSLDGLFPSGIIEMRQQLDPVEGLLIRATLRIPTRASLRTYVAQNSISFGAYALIHNKIFMGGSILLANMREYLTLLPVTKGVLTAQSTNPVSAASPFWSSQKRCRIQLSVQGAGRHGLWCEVKKASCEASHKTSRCSPSCVGLVGGTFVVPDGLPFIIGG